MKPEDVNGIVGDYIHANLSPRKPEREMIGRRYEGLQRVLEGRTFQNGSWARHTSTTPVNDLDVFYVLPESLRKAVLEKRIRPEELSLENILEDLGTALEKRYKSEANVVVQPHSVGIFFGSKEVFSIDVVPAQEADTGLFWVPESALRSIRARRLLYESLERPGLRWIKSDPKGYIAQATALDDSTGGEFRRAAKFVKQWKGACKEARKDFPLKSFHLEIILTELHKANPALSCVQAVRSFFALLPSVLDAPQYPDRADAKRFIDDYVADLSLDAKRLAFCEQEVALAAVNEALAADTDAKVLQAIMKLLKVSNASALPKVVVPSTSTIRPAYSKPYCQ